MAHTHMNRWNSTSALRAAAIIAGVCVGSALPAHGAWQDTVPTAQPATPTTDAAAQPTTPSTTQPAAPNAPSDIPVVKPLEWGDPAPTLNVETWLKGEKVERFEAGKVYIIDMWATWCVPCHESSPRLSSIQKEYKDKGVTVIGVSIWEEAYAIPDGQGTYLDRAKRFVDAAGESMDFRVAFDGAASRTSQDWMHRANRVLIPAAFIVDKQSRIAWIGHPMDPGMKTVLDEVLAGTYDIAAAAKAAKEKRDEELRVRRAENRARIALDGLDAAEAERAVGRLLEIDAKRYGPWALRYFEMTLIPLGDPPNAYRYARTIMDGPLGQDPAIMNQLAWIIVDQEGVAVRDLAVAQTAATRAGELTGSKDATIIGTLAKCHYLKGELAKAIEMQQKAVDAATDAKWKEELTHTLNEWKSQVR